MLFGKSQIVVSPIHQRNIIGGQLPACVIGQQRMLAKTLHPFNAQQDRRRLAIAFLDLVDSDQPAVAAIAALVKLRA